jgi:hypothetical protein
VWPSSSSAAGGDVDTVVAGAEDDGLVAAAVLADAGCTGRLPALARRSQPATAISTCGIISGRRAAGLTSASPTELARALRSGDCAH